MTQIYLIIWRGRDSDSGVWDDYVCWDYGFFDNHMDCEKVVNELNKTSGEYDSDAEDYEKYYVKIVKKGVEK